MNEKLFAAGGVISALAASTCCVAPLILASIGVSGAWVGNLAFLAPYQPVFITLAIICLAAGFWLVYRPPARACPTGTVSRFGRFTVSAVWVKAALWGGAALVVITLGSANGFQLAL